MARGTVRRMEIQMNVNWIDINCTKPDTSRRVLVSCSNGDQTSIGRYNHISESWDLYLGCGSITHWCELPLPHNRTNNGDMKMTYANITIGDLLDI